MSWKWLFIVICAFHLLQQWTNVSQNFNLILEMNGTNGGAEKKNVDFQINLIKMETKSFPNHKHWPCNASNWSDLNWLMQPYLPKKGIRLKM